jgi:exopolyphosphatase / guanosine-5'-triphosphate,3'-diphosphate pyrophosphatase
LALNGDIPGLDGRDRAMAAALVRYHNRKSEPDAHHPGYAVLSNTDKRIARRLAAILRIAEGLDHSHRQLVTGIGASFQRGSVALQIKARGDTAEDLSDAQRSAELFEREFHVHLYLKRI